MFPVLVMRYEDMLANTFEVFSGALKFIGLTYSDEQILNAIDASGFEQLSRQETERGFKEKNEKKQCVFLARAKWVTGRTN